jgi:hypothetical protein
MGDTGGGGKPEGGEGAQRGQGRGGKIRAAGRAITTTV